MEQYYLLNEIFILVINYPNSPFNERYFHEKLAYRRPCHWMLVGLLQLTLVITFSQPRVAKLKLDEILIKDWIERLLVQIIH